MPTVLIVAASPREQDRLRLGAEVRDIRNSLQRSRNRENWMIQSNEAITVDDLRRAMLDFSPTVLHFSGHGKGHGGLCFEDPDGKTHMADAAPLAKLFHHFKNELKCVVLNACYSNVQADIFRKEIDYVVGMRSAVSDDSAVKFAVAFYDAVFAGTNFRTAFELGCTALDLNRMPDAGVPILMTGAHLEATTLAYSSHVPEVERVLYAYFNAPFRDRARFTTTGDSLAPIIEHHFGPRMRRDIDKVRVLSMDSLTRDQWRVLCEISAGEHRQQTTMYVRIRDRTILVEWEASVGHWSIPVKTYLALGSKHPVIARVDAELDDYYNHEFVDEKPSFQSVKLRTKTRITLHGYVKRRTEVYEDLIKILSDGNTHSLTLEIINATIETKTPLIKKLLSPTWLYFPLENTA